MGDKHVSGVRGMSAPTKRPKLDRSARTHYLRGTTRTLAGSVLERGSSIDPFAADFRSEKAPAGHIEVLLVERGQLGLGVLGAPRARLRHRGEVATGVC